MSILEKILGNKKEKKTTTDSKDNKPNDKSDNNYNFESFKETIIQNTILFDIGRSYIDDDRLTSNFLSQKYPQISKNVDINFRRKIGELAPEKIEQIIIHIIDEDVHKDHNHRVYIIFDKDTIKISSSTFKLSPLAKAKGHKDFTTLKNINIASQFEGLNRIMESTNEFGKRFEYTQKKEETIKFDEIPNYLNKLDANFVNIWNSIITGKPLEFERKTNYGFTFDQNTPLNPSSPNQSTTHKR